jgi:hypothetical protein
MFKKREDISHQFELLAAWIVEHHGYYRMGTGYSTDT